MTTKQFEKIKKYLSQSVKGVEKGLYSYYVWEYLDIILCRELVGEKSAIQNSNTLKKYAHFFTTIKNDTFNSFILEIATFFDKPKKGEKNLSINKITNCVLGDKKFLTKKEFAEYNEGRFYLNGLLEKYKGVGSEEIQEIDKIIEGQSDNIQKIKNIRDKFVAHREINFKSCPLPSNSDIENMFKDMIRMIDLVSYELDRHSYSGLMSIKDYIRNDIDRMIVLL